MAVSLMNTMPVSKCAAMRLPREEVGCDDGADQPVEQTVCQRGRLLVALHPEDHRDGRADLLMKGGVVRDRVTG